MVILQDSGKKNGYLARSARKMAILQDLQEKGSYHQKKFKTVANFP